MIRRFRLPLAAGLCAVAAAGAAYAAERAHVMNVAMPDGSVAQVAYQGDVAPRVVLVPAAAVAPQDPFAEMDRMMAAMQVRHAQMMREVAAMQAAAAQAPAAPQGMVMTSTGAAPQGVVRYQMVSTTTSTGANGCTQTVSWSSDGRQAQPQVTRTSSGDCSAVEKNAPAHPAAEVREGAPPVAPAHKA